MPFVVIYQKIIAGEYNTYMQFMPIRLSYPKSYLLYHPFERTHWYIGID